MHVDGRWVKELKHKHEVNMQTFRDLNPQPSCSEVTALTTATAGRKACDSGAEKTGRDVEEERRKNSMNTRK